MCGTGINVMTDSSTKTNRFKPAMPIIPGVPLPADEIPGGFEKVNSSNTALWADRSLQIRAAAALLILLCLVLVVFRVLKKEPIPAALILDSPAADGTSALAGSAAPGDLPLAPGPVALSQDMGKPWSLAKFQLKLPTGERAPAMVIRLPGGSGSSAYWGLLSVAQYGQCELELVTDVAKIESEYGFRARHPMVVDSCAQTVYDPLSYGRAHGRLMHGQVVKGPGMRPPLAVEILIQKGSLVATRSE